MSKAGYYLSAAIIANEYVKKKMTIGASNKLRPDFWRAWKCSGSLIQTGEMREYVDRQVSAAFDADTNPVVSNLDYRLRANRIYLEKSAEGAELYGCGNCGEQSAVAFIYLRNQKTFPLDWMEVNNYEHAFVVIGRKRGSDPATPSTWGSEAVICDPWRGVTASVQSQTTYFSNRKPNWIYGEIG